MPKVLLLDGVDKKALDMLKNAGIEADLQNSLTLEEKMKTVGEYEAAVIRSATTFDKALLDAATKMKLIVRAGEGTDNIDKPYAASKGIVVENTPGQNSHAVAELALGHMLAISRKLQVADTGMKQGKWEKSKLEGVEIKGKVLGILGGGKIGKDLGKMGEALGMEVVVYDVISTDPECKYVSLDELLSQSDYISIHVPLNDKTKGMIGMEQLKKMKKTAYLINCARGGIVTESDLAEALKNGIIKGAAFDVFSKEPVEPTNPLLSAPNIYFTPHIGAASEEAQINCAVAAAEQIIAFFKEGKALNKVN